MGLFSSYAYYSPPRTKKADVAEHPQAFDHVGLLVNKPPEKPGCYLFSHPTNLLARLLASMPHPLHRLNHIPQDWEYKRAFAFSLNLLR
jgi:hypothetical protein